MMKLPEQVLEVASFLKESNDPRFQTMCALITPRKIERWHGDYQDDTHYEKMWGHLKKHEENIKGELTTNDWVFSFLDDVIAAQQLPKYFYIDIDKRLELIMKLNDLRSQRVIRMHGKSVQIAKIHRRSIHWSVL